MLALAAFALVASCASASASNVFSGLPSVPAEGRYGPAAATLPDGNVLIAGGDPEGLPVALLTAEEFNPRTGRFERLEGHDMVEGRAEFEAVTLHSGDVLLVGGSRSGSPLSTAELFDPKTDTFEVLKSHLTQERDAPAVAELADGMVLIADGCQSGKCSKTAELFDPATQTFSKLATSPLEERYAPAAATLRDGNVLIAGGYPNSGEAVKSTELFNAKTGTFETLGSSHELLLARGEDSAVTLQDGNVLVVGGAELGKAFSTNELFDAQTSAFTAASTELVTQREASAVALLHDGQVLVADGCHQVGCSASAEIMSVNRPSRATTARATRRAAHHARINALVEAETNSTVYFQYGTSRRYRHRTRVQAIAGSTAPVAVSALLTRLTPGKRYHYRVVIENSAGKLVGADRSFVAPRRRR